MRRQQRIRIGLCFAIFSTILVFVCQRAQGQEFPTKPIVLINPGGPGGSQDLTSRAVTSVSAKYLGQPVIVQTKAGGAGAVGSEFVATTVTEYGARLDVAAPSDDEITMFG